MEKALARNPNLLRTLLGLSMALILVLGYSVYSASLDSEYYIYSSSMNSEEMDLNLEESRSDKMVWTASTNGTLSWVNFSLTGVPEGSTLEITSGGERWWSHEMLGSSDADNFNCLEPNQDFEIINQCEYSFSHSQTADDEGTIRLIGLISDELPLSGLGTLRSENLSSAELSAKAIYDLNTVNVTWLITLTSETAIDNATVSMEGIVVDNNLESVEQFRLNPIVESIWSLTALMSCFAMILFLPLGIYYASIKREQRLQKIRDKTEE